MQVTIDQLRAIMPHAGSRAVAFLVPMNDAMVEFDISTPMRQAAFLAQVAHESGELRWTAEIWGPTASQNRYEGRSDLGNTEPGDGRKFKGRGLLQLTGRDNYAKASKLLYGDSRLLDQPELLEQPVGACRSAGLFWQSKGLNLMADEGDFDRITRRINGGFNGQAERRMFYQKAMEVLS